MVQLFGALGLMAVWLALGFWLGVSWARRRPDVVIEQAKVAPWEDVLQRGGFVDPKTLDPIYGEVVMPSELKRRVDGSLSREQWDELYGVPPRYGRCGG